MSDQLTKKLAQKFLKSFSSTLYIEDTKSFPKDGTKYLSNILFDLALKRKDSDPQITIVTPTQEDDNIDFDSSIVNVVNDDKPFLVDSLTAAINDLGYHINLIVNKVIYVERDKNGNLTDINYNSKDHSLKAESVLQLHIKKLYSEETKESIKSHLLYILKHVDVAVSDWVNTIDLLEDARHSIVKTGHCPDDKHEAIDFIDWTLDNNFIFLGFSETYFKKNHTSVNFIQKEKENLGIQKIDNYDDLDKIPRKVFFQNNCPIIIVSKLIAKSPVHRPVNLDMIRITVFDDKLNPTGELRFIGLFTSKLFYQYAKDIPLIRKKIDYVTSKANFDPKGHNGKALVSILESYPREELFPIKKAELLDISLGIIKLSGSNAVKTFFRIDPLSRFISVICFIPKQNFTSGIRRDVQKILAAEISPNITSHATLISDQPLARVHFIIVVKDNDISKVNYEKIETLIAESSVNWRDQIEKEIFKNFDEKLAIDYFNNFADCFPVSYQEHFKIKNAISDISKIDRLIKNKSPIITLSRKAKDNNLFNLKLYTLGTQVTLSDIMPTLNNFGLNVISENIYLIEPNNNDEDIWLNHFIVSIDLSNVEYNSVKKHFESAVLDCWLNKYENDHLNQLLLKASFNIHDISLIRSLLKYIIQTNFSFSLDFIENTLVEYPEITKSIRDLFYEKFDPDNKHRNVKKLHDNLNSKLQKISNISHDTIFKKLIEIIENMVRTNFFQTHKENYISFKLLSRNISDLLLPKPYAEIFVYSSDTEGVHLRGGKVARGGIRWSDRVADYRTEVHGLAKAQMTKNSIIVPVGSKGGFIVKKDTSKFTRDELYQAGVESYSIFLSGLLDITDNIIDEKIVKPSNVVCYDDDDPYLVVAADKGTATFSDIANKISAKYNFWLGDAFASGGSNGYDHKKMGITAKGAWQSVTRHFFEAGININKDEFSVVGIGDMSGDVFGNGMLLSKNIKLIAAFNHMHIFIDPNPNAASSFKERSRLFKLPRSSWTDYNPKLISKGGGVFSRSLKSIKLSKEIVKLLNLTANTLTPTELIQSILKANVDLLWNGGIGTYIKSSSETNAEVGDKNNDNLRVDAKELNCSIIGEGGNLGLTQKGRIEFALHGGRINTDSIDNSGGVNCSDNEVNIKIALQDLISKKSITLTNRDKLLEDMTDGVEESVLHDSLLSAQAVSLAESNKYNALDHQERLMKTLEESELLDRKVEFLPDSEEMNRRKSEKVGLTRPELCVLLSYSKIYLYNDLVNSSLPDQSYYLNELIKYFPEKLVKKYQSDLFNHPLKREIICTFVANSMINRLGITFFNRISNDTGLKICDIARAYTIIKDSFELPLLWRNLEDLTYDISAEIQIKMFRKISKFIEHTTLWLLRIYRNTLNEIENYISVYHDKLEVILNNLEKVLSKEALASFNQNYNLYKSNNVPDKIARKIAALEFIPSVYQIIYVSQDSKLELLPIAKIYFNLGIRMHFRYLYLKAADLNADTYWEKLSIRSYVNNLFDQQMRITSDVVKGINKKITLNDSENEVSKWLESNNKQISRYFDLIADVQSHEFPDFSMLNVAGHRIKEISSTIENVK
ncbi:MAG: NAD-glutamate dehydrogenase [Rickettsiales bacterium]|nr:NAD-glutamate dehydrogenase [Rickettsiales bacterium]